MSAGAFTVVPYRASYNTEQIHPLRIQPETQDLAVLIGGTNQLNTPEEVATNNPISAVISRGRRSKGLNARLIRVRFTAAPPTGYQVNGTLTLPAINPALLGAPNGATGTYLGIAIEVVGTSPETAR